MVFALTLTIALNYGSRREIALAARALAIDAVAGKLVRDHRGQLAARPLDPVAPDHDQEIAFAAGVLLNIYRFHPYTENSISPFLLQVQQFERQSPD